MSSALADVIVGTRSHRAYTPAWYVRTWSYLSSLLKMLGIATAQIACMAYYAGIRILWPLTMPIWWTCQIRRAAAVALAFLASQMIVWLPVLHGDVRICMVLWLVDTLALSWYFWLKTIQEFISQRWR